MVAVSWEWAGCLWREMGGWKWSRQLEGDCGVG